MKEGRPPALAIIGGGAAGMFAAATAASLGKRCVLIERKARLGSKVLMTANGRCNFTKDITAERFLSDISLPGAGSALSDFLREAVRSCPPRRIMECFRSLRLKMRRMPDGRMFPADGKAASVVHAFGDFFREKSVPVLTNFAVTGIERAERGCFVIRSRAFDLTAENVLVATGGVSYPKTGSTGDGQVFARAFGHDIVPYRPGLIGLETDDRRVTSLAGRRFENGRVEVFPSEGDARPLFACDGEVDCESFGLSGGAVYNAERFLESTGVSDCVMEVRFGKQRLRFGRLSPRPVKEAIVTLGGVSLDGIDPSTMQSKKVPGLYFAGEVMDVDGPTGGYNLTIAFATACRAVESALVPRRSPGGRRK